MLVKKLLNENMDDKTIEVLKNLIMQNEVPESPQLNYKKEQSISVS